jgi:hypothetical protein
VGNQEIELIIPLSIIFGLITAAKKIIILSNQDKAAEPIAKEWLKRLFLYVTRKITKNAKSGGIGINQVISS